MNALEATGPLDGDLIAAPELDADGWFSSLDNRTIQVGVDTCVAQVLGIHAGQGSLWIQLACADDPDMTVVVQVTAATRLEDVLSRLRHHPPTGQPLEIIDCSRREAHAAPGRPVFTERRRVLRHAPSAM